MTRKQDKRRTTTYAHPSRTNDHSERRWWKRWRSGWSFKLALSDLRQRMQQAKLVEVDESNLQAVWRLPEEAGLSPLLVVNSFGLVKTVLPRAASYDPDYTTKGRGHPPKLPGGL